jgi:hypothetical protein
MPKNKISEYSTTNSSNTDIESINIDEGCAPSGINNAIRELMVHLKEFQTGSSGDPLTVAGTFVASGGATLSGTNTLSGSTVMTASAGTSASPSIHFSSDTNTGIFSPAADTIAFAEGGVEAMRIDSSGNLGLGVTPSAWGSPVQTALQLKGGASFASWGSFGGAYTVANAFYNGTNWIYLADNLSGLYVNENGVHYWYNAASGTAGNNITFTERMRIDSSGNLLVGTTSAAAGSGTTVSNANNSIWAFRAQSSAATTPNGVLVKYSGASPNDTGNQFIYCEDSGGTQRMSVRSNGGIANYSGNDANLSDRREKTNFAPAKSYLDVICAIPVQTFNYIDQNLAEDDGLTLGVVAQDVQEVAPELVMESNWAGRDEEPKMRLSIYQTDLQYALMKCIQELKAELDTVKAELATLKG